MSNNDRPFINQASHADKVEALRNEQRLKRGDREPTTLHQLSRLGLDEEGGRFAQARYVTGSEAATRYPAASGPWTAGNDAGLEPPLNQDVSFVEPCGEQWEIEASIAEQELGEPETGAITQGLHLPLRPSDQQLSESAVEVSGSPPSLKRHEATTHLTPGERRSVGSATCDAPHSPSNLVEDCGSDAEVKLPPQHALSKTASTNPPEVPDDGLDVERRSDGTPLSSHTRRKVT
jgi:hypothetical protein